MSLLGTAINRFTWKTGATDGFGNTRGVSVTPGNNTKGSWAQLLTAIANDCYLIHVQISAGSVSAAARDMIVDIGVDPAGGTAYTVAIPDLLGSCARGLNVGGPSCLHYTFPLFIPAGATVAARASVNNATVGTVRVWCSVFGQPTHPHLVRAGAVVEAFGITAASSSGTAVTPGNNAEGAYAQLGANLVADFWWWQLGVGVNDTTMGGTSIVYRADLHYGDATTKHPIIDNQVFGVDTAEALNMSGADQLLMAVCNVPAGNGVFGRMGAQAAPDASMSMAAYGLRG